MTGASTLQDWMDTNGYSRTQPQHHNDSTPGDHKPGCAGRAHGCTSLAGVTLPQRCRNYQVLAVAAEHTRARYVQSVASSIHIPQRPEHMQLTQLPPV
jgi:hypothetical protein